MDLEKASHCKIVRDFSKIPNLSKIRKSPLADIWDINPARYTTHSFRSITSTIEIEFATSA
jgi:hypothetical protein